MTRTPEVETVSKSAQPQDRAVPSARDISQPPKGFGMTGDEHAGDQPVWTVAEKARDEIAKNIEPAKRFVDEQKAGGARKIGNIAQVIRGAAGQLEPELPGVANSVRAAAGLVEQAGTALRERSVEDLVATCTNFARAQPAAFFVAAAFTGFVAARFIKSSIDKSSVDPARGNPTS